MVPRTPGGRRSTRESTDAVREGGLRVFVARVSNPVHPTLRFLADDLRCALGMATRRGWVLPLVALALLAGAVLAFFVGRTSGELAELAAEGSHKRLREPMRPARGAPRVLVFALDGVGADELEAAIRGGRARNLARLLGKPLPGEP